MRGIALAFLAGLLLASMPTQTAESDAIDPNARREEVVALVLAQDPRFGDVPDFRRQEQLAGANFDWTYVLGSSYYRVLTTLASDLGGEWFDLDYSANQLVEVTLVDGCVGTATEEGPSSDTVPLPDPCAWRHTWFYRVAPDDTVTLLFEEGAQDPMASE